MGNNRRVPTLSDLLGQSDFVSFHVPATPETRDMLGATELAQMKRGSYLVNANGVPVTGWPEPIDRRPVASDLVRDDRLVDRDVEPGDVHRFVFVGVGRRRSDLHLVSSVGERELVAATEGRKRTNRQHYARLALECRFADAIHETPLHVRRPRTRATNGPRRHARNRVFFLAIRVSREPAPRIAAFGSSRRISARGGAARARGRRGRDRPRRPSPARPA
ncbi:MAG TPA: NAD(P)-dependent oxidoreductase [Polyangiaceae bacterium]